jgi:hypothetical protein
MLLKKQDKTKFYQEGAAAEVKREIKKRKRKIN